MATFFQRIWEAPVYLPYLQPDLTDKAVREAEKKLGVPLPESLVRALSVQNGGYLRMTLPDSGNRQIAGIGPYFPSLLDVDLRDHAEWVSFDLVGLVPFDGDGHWYLCLDYRGSEREPRVAYIDTECDCDEPVSETFDGYLAQLRLKSDHDFAEYAVVGESDVPEIVGRLSSALNKRFEVTDEWAHGYSQFRARVAGTTFAPEWVWLTPNRVPRGYVRIDDPRYEELKGLLGGWGLRYPEVPDAICTITTTDGAESALLQACRRASVSVRKIEELIE